MEKIGIIWDLDGTIIDSVGMYYEAYQRVFAKYGLGTLGISREEYTVRYFGKAVEVLLWDYVPKTASEADVAAMKWDYLLLADDYLKTSPDGGIRLLDGVDEVISAFFDRGYPQAIASTSWMPAVVHCLEKIGLLEKFGNIASGYRLPSKPAPDVFRLAAAVNNIPCERCVAFEDSLAGMKGAKAAGMKCVGISTSVPVSRMTDADICLNSYRELRIENVEALFS